MSEHPSRRALLTGATGFVGTHLVRHLRESGWTVHAVVRPASDISGLREAVPARNIHVDDSTKSLLTILEESKPAVVFHLASRFVSSHSHEDIPLLFEANLLFGTRLAEAMAASGVRSLVNTGSSWQHYESRGYRSVNLYAATKQAFEDILQYYVDAHGLRAITLKLFDTYGPEDHRQKLFYFLRQALEGRAVPMSPGEQLLDLVHVSDVVEAFHLAGQRLLAGEVGGYENYAVSSGQPVSLRHVVTLLEEHLGRSLPIEWAARPYRKREVMEPGFSGPPLAGWNPKVDLTTGIVGFIQDATR